MPTAAEIDALVVRYRDYARSLTMREAATLPKWIDRDELLSAGYEGLLDAARRFDPARGFQFTTFSYYRIRGAVLDAVRRACAADPTTRMRVAAAKAIDQVAEAAGEADRAQPASSPADALERVAEVIDAAAVAFAMVEHAAADVTARAPDAPDEGAQQSEARAQIAAALDRLPEKEAAMLRDVYLRDRTIEEAGAAMGLSKSWASRLHKRALQLARAELATLWSQGSL